METVIEKTPHLRRKASTFLQMMYFFSALVVLWLFAIITYFVRGGATYGVKVIVLGLVSMCFSVLADCLFYLPTLFKKDVENKGREYLYQVIHSYSFVTGLVLTLLVTVGIKWWQLGLTSFLATFVMKLVFGGFGRNVMNPAVFGRVFAQLVFGSDLSKYSLIEGGTDMVTTGASITSSSKSFVNVVNAKFPSILLGTYNGTLGETFLLLLAAICIALVVLKVIDWRTPVFYICTIYLASVIAFLGLGDGGWAFKDALIYTAVGGIVFGGVICLTDPVTSPTSNAGRIIFALLAAFLTLLIRYFTNAKEGVAYSILIANFFVPFIDKIVKGRTKDNLRPIIIISGLGLAIIALSLTFGLTRSMDASTGVITNLLEAK